MLDKYRNLDFEAYVRLHDLQNILAHYDVEDDFYRQINACMELIRTKRYRVAVIGEFSRGKSSLLNAMLGSRILPADITPTTATINRIVFDLEPRAELHGKDGSVIPVGIHELEQSITKLTEENEANAEKVREAVIYYPTVICQNNIELIDTPGLNEDQKMTQLTISQFERIDAAIVLISALSPVDQVEQDLIARLIQSPEVDCLVFVVSFLDCIEEKRRESVMKLIRSRIQGVQTAVEKKCGADSPEAQKAAQILGSPELYGVSSSLALDAMEANDPRQLRESGLPQFQKELYRILTARQSANALLKTYRLMLESPGYLEDWYQQKRSRLEQRLEECRQDFKDLNQCYTEYPNREQAILLEHFIKKSDIWDQQKQEEGLVNLCIHTLGTVQENTADAILAAVSKLDGNITHLSRAALADAFRQLKALSVDSLNRLCDERQEGLIRVCQKIAPDLSWKFSDTIPREVRSSLNALFTAPQIDYRFFAPGEPWRLADEAVQRETRFTLCDPVHCNYIPYIRLMVASYNRIIAALYQEEKQTAIDTLCQLGQKDKLLRGQLTARAEKRISEAVDNITVHEKLYETHQQDLSNLSGYCTEMIRDFQGGTL